MEKSCQEDDVADDKDATKVFDSLAALQACLLKNEHRNMILFPTRDQREMSNSGVESLARSLEANTSLVSLTLEEVHLSSIHGIQPLVYALFNHRNLKRLTLYDNRLGNDGVAFLINAIQSGSYASLPRYVVPSMPIWFPSRKRSRTLRLKRNPLARNLVSASPISQLSRYK